MGRSGQRGGRADVGIGRLIRRHRRLLAGVAAAGSIAALGLALQPPAPITRPVVVAAGDLPAGHVLAAPDLAVADVPAGVLPAGTSAESTTFLGRALAAPMARGEALAAHRLTTLPAWAVPAGTMPMPVRFADAGAAGLLAAGIRIDVLAASGPGLDSAESFAPAELVARDILVLGILRTGGDAADKGILGGSASEDQSSPLVVLAADEPAALAIAGAEGRASLSFLMRPGPA
jgi:Flp pilus assembly protein CpaB